MRLPLEVANKWGGARRGAGRKPRGRPSMPHVTRSKIDPRYPLQVTIRATRGLPSLRSTRVFGALRRAIARASVNRFRVIHFSIQQDHGHFIVEGDEARRARGGMHGLAIRLALAVNRVLGRKGKVVGDRYHVRPLTTPRQMRTSMVYVLLNFRKHLRAPAGVDPRSSGPHFGGWQLAPGRTVPQPRLRLRPGWRRSVGTAPAVRCGSKNIRPPRPGRARLDSGGRAFQQCDRSCAPEARQLAHQYDSLISKTSAEEPRPRAPGLSVAGIMGMATRGICEWV
jgi:hypothetical protein